MVLDSGTVPATRRGMTRPTLLYKYRGLAGDSFRYVQAMVTRREVFLSGIEKMNDPAEGFFSVPSAEQLLQGKPPGFWATVLAVGEAVMPSETDALKKTIAESGLTKVGILALSADPANTLMWAHYGDNHRGACFGFSAREGTTFAAAQPMNYLATPVTPKSLLPDAVAKHVLLHKSDHWNYEQEWRLLGQIGPLRYAPSELEEVVFGFKCPAADRRWIFEWCERSEARVRFREARLKPNSYAIELHDVPAAAALG